MCTGVHVVDSRRIHDVDHELFKLLAKYKPETLKEKKERLAKAAEQKAKSGETSQGSKPYFVKSGLNHITHLIEQKKAQLVIIAHDVDPIEVCWHASHGTMLWCVHHIDDEKYSIGI